MICPDDGASLDETKVKSFYGWEVTIDRCPSCGGMWFDGMELFPIDNREAIKVDTLKSLTMVDSTGKKCPRCAGILTDFVDPNLPGKLTIHSCDTCRGMWLYAGMLTDYKQYQAEKKAQLSQRLAMEEWEKRKQMERETTIEHMSKFLMTPYYGNSEQSIQARNVATLAFGIFRIILEILMRLK
jgi:uncharacterized protein